MNAALDVIRVVIVDDHSLVREALVQSIALEPDMEVCGEAGDGQQGLLLCDTLNPDLVVLDFSLPDMTGVDVVDALNAAGRRPRVLLLTGAPMDDEERAQLSRQVEGFLHKEAGRDALVAAIRTAAGARLKARTASRDDDRTGVLNASALTPRERAVLREIAKGRSIEDIAQTLGMSPSTARKHRENIMGKLSLNSTAALVRAAMQIGSY
jgi:DNA-binding NarL/FixJ family response regulator